MVPEIQEVSVRQQSQKGPELHQSLTQQLQDTFDLEEVSGMEMRERQEKSSGFLPLGLLQVYQFSNYNQEPLGMR